MASMSVKQMLKQALRMNHIAKETGNRELQTLTREFIRKYFPRRHDKNIVFIPKEHRR